MCVQWNGVQGWAGLPGAPQGSGQGHIAAIAACDIDARTCPGNRCSRAGAGEAPCARLPSSPALPSPRAGELPGRKPEEEFGTQLSYTKNTGNVCQLLGISSALLLVLVKTCGAVPGEVSLASAPCRWGSTGKKVFLFLSLLGNLSLPSLFSVLQFIYGVPFISTGRV